MKPDFGDGYLTLQVVMSTTYLYKLALVKFEVTVSANWKGLGYSE